jgi:DnaJ-class molecular chaperone
MRIQHGTTTWYEVECPECHGEGGYSYSNHNPLSETGYSYEVCPRCEGAGKVELSEDAYMDACLGTGELAQPDFDMVGAREVRV